MMCVDCTVSPDTGKHNNVLHVYTIEQLNKSSQTLARYLLVIITLIIILRSVIVDLSATGLVHILVSHDLAQKSELTHVTPCP